MANFFVNNGYVRYTLQASAYGVVNYFTKINLKKKDTKKTGQYGWTHKYILAIH